MQPNVLFMLVDCLRADVCYGWRGGARTPHIDGLVERGVVFDQMISTTSTTSPCVTSLLTGAYPFEHGVRSLSGSRIPPERATLPGALKKAGYGVHAEVTGPLSESLGLAQSFDGYRYRDKDTNVHSPWFDTLRKKLHNLEEPWFMFLHLWEAHETYAVPRGFNSRRYGATPYERAISALDAKIGEILEVLPADTLIVLHGDHGEHYERGLLKRGTKRVLHRLGRPVPYRLRELKGHGHDVHEHVVRVPLVLSGYSAPAGVRVGEQARQVDVAPTILDLVGAGGLPGPIHGESLVGRMGGEKGEDLPAYVEACGPVLRRRGIEMRGLRLPPWKLVVREEGDERELRLYDVRRDPEEKTDLADAMPEKVRELEARLEELSRPLGGGPGAEEMSAEEMEILERRLSELGYIE